MEAKRLAVEAAREHGEAELWVQHSDRLARGDGLSADHLGEIFFEMRRHCVRLRSVQDDGNLEDVIRAVLIGERNNEDSSRKSAAIQAGAHRRAERGDYHGGPAPYGYRWRSRQVGDKLVRDLVHDRGDAAVVRRIFREYAAGRRQQQIARDLHREKVPARRTEWMQATISGMVKNPIYVGRVRTKREERPGNHRAIIDAETWAAAQQRLAATRKTKGGGRGRPSSGSHLFTNGMLKCGVCGGPMVPRTIKPRSKTATAYEVYRCFNRMRDPDACDQPPVRREEIDDPTLAYFTDVVVDMDATLAQLQLHEDARRAEVGEQREQAEREQLRLAGERDRVERDYRAGDLPASRYDELFRKIEEEQQAAAAQVEQLRAREQELSAESLLAVLDTDTTAMLTEMRARIVEHVRGAGDIEAVRAALLALFDGFTLMDGRTRRLEPGRREPSDVLASDTYSIELHLRPDAISGFKVEQEDSAEWFAPVFDKVAVPLSSMANNYSNASPSQ